MINRVKTILKPLCSDKRGNYNFIRLNVQILNLTCHLKWLSQSSARAPARQNSTFRCYLGVIYGWRPSEVLYIQLSVDGFLFWCSVWERYPNLNRKLPIVFHNAGLLSQQASDTLNHIPTTKWKVFKQKSVLTVKGSPKALLILCIVLLLLCLRFDQQERIIQNKANVLGGYCDCRDVHCCARELCTAYFSDSYSSASDWRPCATTEGQEGERINVPMERINYLHRRLCHQGNLGARANLGLPSLLAHQRVLPGPSTLDDPVGQKQLKITATFLCSLKL